MIGKSGMNLNEAINIVAEEAVRCRRLAEDMLEPPIDPECVARAEERRRLAEAMEKLVNVARVFSRTADE